MTAILSSSKYLEFAYKLYCELQTTEINLAYVGGVTQEITRNFTVMTEENLIRHKESNPVQRKVFNVMVESIQNISRHADVLPGDSEDERQGMILISHNDSAYNVVTGNLLRSDKVEKLRNRLEEVNRMDRNQLSEAYKKQIQDGEISERGGAGLGFLDIAKKCKHAIDFRFYDIEGLDDYCFFISIATISRN